MFNEGEFWKTQRKFAIRHLRDFGFGKKTIESVILEEAEDFFRYNIGNKDIVQVSILTLH